MWVRTLELNFISYNLIHSYDQTNQVHSTQDMVKSQINLFIHMKYNTLNFKVFEIFQWDQQVFKLLQFFNCGFKDRIPIICA